MLRKVFIRTAQTHFSEILISGLSVKLQNNAQKTNELVCNMSY